jgi:hypothetical protein
MRTSRMHGRGAHATELHRQHTVSKRTLPIPERVQCKTEAYFGIRSGKVFRPGRSGGRVAEKRKTAGAGYRAKNRLIE